MAQLGRYYPLEALVGPDTARLAQDIKGLLDPEGQLNPGALGLAEAP